MQAILRVFKRSPETGKMDFKNSIFTQNCFRLFALPTPFVGRMVGDYIKISGTESCPSTGSHDPGILVRTEYAVYSLQADIFTGAIQFSLRLIPFLELATRVQVLL